MVVVDRLCPGLSPMLGTVAAELGGPSPPAEMLQWTAGVCGTAPSVALDTAGRKQKLLLIFFLKQKKLLLISSSRERKLSTNHTSPLLILGRMG